METNDNKEKNLIETTQKKGIMHYILSGEYVAFLFAFILGVTLELIFPNKILATAYSEYVGLIFAILGTILIYWAQITSKKLAKNPPSEPTFRSGPYKYLRNPTHSGVVIMMFGCALMIHSLFFLIFIFIAAIFSRLTILNKQDKILTERYGEKFENYKKDVKDIL